MSEYTLSIGGEKDATDSDVYTDQTALSVTQSASSVDSWSATLGDGGFDDVLLDPIWIYHTPDGGTDDVVFRGELETFETDYESGLTTISGRGPLVKLDRDVISRTFDSTTAYQAIIDTWAETDFDALVSPPNSDIFDESFLVEWEHRYLWGYFGADYDSAIVTDGVDVDRNRLVFSQPNVLLDDTDSDGQQAASVNMDTQTDRVWLRIETTDPVGWIRAGLKQHNGSLGTGSIETVTQTNDYNTPQNVHLFDLEFAQSHDLYRPLVETGDYTTSITRTDVIVADQSDFVQLDSVEIDGTRLDVLQELHDLASYEFTVEDYGQLDVRSFPVGTLAPEPDWDIISATRQQSFEGYANSVTVQGGRDGGSPPVASASDSTEINEFSEIARFEKDPGLTTSSGVQDRADRLLKESIDERDEGGTLEIAPQFVPVGYSYNVSVWGDAFPYGGQIGNNSLYFDSSSYIEWEWDGSYVGGNAPNFGDYLTLEAIVSAQDLDELGDNQYRTLWYIKTKDTDSERFFVRVYGDGSLGLGTTLSNEQFTRTSPGIINNEDAQRLSVQWRKGGDERRVIVDGQLEAEQTGLTTSFFLDDSIFRLGTDDAGNNGFVGGIDDVRVWADNNSFRSTTFIRDYLRSDLVTEQVDFSQLVFYFRFDDRFSPVTNDAVTTGVTITENNLQYQEAFGQLEEVSYSLGSGEAIDLDFDISGRVDTELIETRRRSRSTRRIL